MPADPRVISGTTIHRGAPTFPARNLDAKLAIQQHQCTHMTTSMLKAHDLKQRWQLSTPTICRCRGRRKPRAQPANAKCNLSLPPTCTNDLWENAQSAKPMRWSNLCAGRSLKRSLVHTEASFRSHRHIGQWACNLPKQQTTRRLAFSLGSLFRTKSSKISETTDGGERPSRSASL